MVSFLLSWEAIQDIIFIVVESVKAVEVCIEQVSQARTSQEMVQHNTVTVGESCAKNAQTLKP